MNMIGELELLSDEELAEMVAGLIVDLSRNSQVNWLEIMDLSGDTDSSRPLVNIALRMIEIKGNHQESEAQPRVAIISHSPSQTER